MYRNDKFCVQEGITMISYLRFDFTFLHEKHKKTNEKNHIFRLNS